jgi:hypothetical protein
MNHTRAGRRLLPALLLWLAAASAWAAKAGAEFSFRWNPDQGGPASAEAALHALGLESGRRSRFDVQYFDIATPADAPPGFEAILRKRTEGATAQLTYKLRGSTPWPDKTSLKQWRCPLPAPNERKDEADIAFLGAGQTSKAWSRSCSHRSARLDIAPPPALRPQPNRCKSSMTRLEAGMLKVEEWHLPDGTRLIEVSRQGHDTHEAGDAFRDRVVNPLLKRQAIPLQRSKSALGGECS